MILRSGTYTGNGTSQTVSIADLGGTVDFLIIWNEAGNNVSFGVSTMGATKSVMLGTDTAPDSTGITAYGTNQFSVGALASVNQNADILHYLAIRDNGVANFKVGSYTGDGAASKAITGFGFQPDYVIVRRDTPSVANAYDSQRDSVSAGARRFDTASLTGRITSLDADGFTVDNTNLPDTNTTSVVYYYAGFKNVAGTFKTAGYTGNGVSATNVTGVGFQPDYVWVVDTTTSRLSVAKSRTMSTNKACVVRATAAITDGILALQSDGFQLGSNALTNTNTEAYHYFSFLAPAPINSSVNTSLMMGV